jgi:Protein of unknown function (DUF998)
MTQDLTTPRAGAAGTSVTRALLAGGGAGPLFILVGLLQAFTRDGFDLRRHPLSLLSNGDLGWIQIANFIVTGRRLPARDTAGSPRHPELAQRAALPGRLAGPVRLARAGGGHLAYAAAALHGHGWVSVPAARLRAGLPADKG